MVSAKCNIFSYIDFLILYLKHWFSLYVFIAMHYSLATTASIVCKIMGDRGTFMQFSATAKLPISGYSVYPKKYAHGFVVLCFVVVMQSSIMNSHEVFIHIHQGCFAGTGAIVRLPQCQWSKPDGYGKISQCIATTKHSKAKTVCIFLGIYCMLRNISVLSSDIQ